MREIVFKNLTSKDPRKKDVLIKEVYEKNGVVARTERRCFYFVRKMVRFDTADDLQSWIESQGSVEQDTGKRQFHILKEHNDDNGGGDKLVCKITGTFYAIFNNSVYTIAFLHYFKVYFMKASLAK